MTLSCTPTIDRAERLIATGDLAGAVDLLLARFELTARRPSPAVIEFDHAGCRDDAARLARISPLLIARKVVAMGVIALMRVESGDDSATIAEETITMLPFARREWLDAVLQGSDRVERFVSAIESLHLPGN